MDSHARNTLTFTVAYTIESNPVWYTLYTTLIPFSTVLDAMAQEFSKTGDETWPFFLLRFVLVIIWNGGGIAVLRLDRPLSEARFRWIF